MGRVFVVSFVFVLLFHVGKTERKDVRDALVDFMDELDPENMHAIKGWGWNKSSDPCTPSRWFKVECDNLNQTVKHITLDQLNLTGRVDFESVCKETNLLKLSLNNNNLSGSLPGEISNCKKLRHLYLTGNRFSGNLPDSLSDLTDLVRVDISNNEFSGELPNLSKDTGLLTFLARNNHFTGQLPKFNYDQLQEFDVSYNDLTGKVPDHTGRFGAKSFIGNPQLCGKKNSHNVLATKGNHHFL